MNIFVDPVVMQPPSLESSKEEVEIWLNGLVGWLSEALSSPFNWLHFRKATAELISHGLFPNAPLLLALQRKHRVDSINMIQLSRTINYFFNNDEYDLEDKLGVTVLVESKNVVVHPQDLVIRWSMPIQEMLLQLLATLCACKCAGDDLACNLNVATHNLGGYNRELRVSTSILEVEPEFPRADTIEATFPLVFTPEDLPISAFHLYWLKGEDSIKTVILRRCKHDWRENAAHSLTFRFGQNFYRSVERENLHFNEIFLGKLLSAISAVIVDKAKDVKGYHLRQVREHKSGNSKQLVRDEDAGKCWRLTLYKDGAGWRLQYWEIPQTDKTRLIEFDRVLKEQDDPI